MVVDDVDQHREAVAMCGVDESAQVVGTPVGARRREQRDAVVAPVPASGEIRERHQLDRGDAEVAKDRQLLDRAAKRPCRRERADVQFVDGGPPGIEPGPVRIGPAIHRGIDHFRPAVNAVGLEAAGAGPAAARLVHRVCVTVTGVRLLDVIRHSTGGRRCGSRSYVHRPRRRAAAAAAERVARSARHSRKRTPETIGIAPKTGWCAVLRRDVAVRRVTATPTTQ